MANLGRQLKFVNTKYQAGIKRSLCILEVPAVGEPCHNHSLSEENAPLIYDLLKIVNILAVEGGRMRTEIREQS